MKELAYNFGNFALYIAFAMLLLAFQTALWLQLMGHFPPPHIAALFIAFWSTYRNFREGLIMAYILSIVVSAFTALPLGLFLVINIVL